MPSSTEWAVKLLGVAVLPAGRHLGPVILLVALGVRGRPALLDEPGSAEASSV